MLVDKRDLISSRSSPLLIQLEELLSCPVMLVARDETDWAGAKVFAHFEAEPFFYALLQAREIDWAEIRQVELTSIE